MPTIPVEVPEGEYCEKKRCEFLNSDWRCDIFKTELFSDTGFKGALKKCPACLKAISQSNEVLTQEEIEATMKDVKEQHNDKD